MAFEEHGQNRRSDQMKSMLGFEVFMRSIVAAIVMIACTLGPLGCSRVTPRMGPQAEGKLPQAKAVQFSIGETDFGIDAKRSRFEFSKDDAGQLYLTIKIYGDDALAGKLSNEEDSEWSWILYAPYFYLSEYPVSSEGKGKEFTVRVKPADLDEYDVALYLMEHNNVKDVEVNVHDGRIEVRGQVDLRIASKSWTPFRIKWEQKR